ncbi:hypothetical protein BC830DRAFT_1120602 [Chytriomyces sp. MP71]|nr:hypothetical protein BC830DRAFT_1120602 [Chytriomyces sp. MP71]
MDSNVKAIQRLNDQELQKGLAESGSWHDDFSHSAYIFIGGLPYHLSEGDIIVVFSQWGEIVDINLLRDRETGKSKGSCFLAYEDQRSTVLAVDNFNGISLVGRTLRVDHVKDYRSARVPKNETEAEHDERVARERRMRLMVLPGHLMDEDERLEAEREGILVRKGLGVGDRAANNVERSSANSSGTRKQFDDLDLKGLSEVEVKARLREREFEMEDPMRDFLAEEERASDKKDKKEKKHKKEKTDKKSKREKKEKKDKKREHHRDEDERQKTSAPRRRSPSPSSSSSRSPSPRIGRKSQLEEDRRRRLNHEDSTNRYLKRARLDDIAPVPSSRRDPRDKGDTRDDIRVGEQGRDVHDRRRDYADNRDRRRRDDDVDHW